MFPMPQCPHTLGEESPKASAMRITLKVPNRLNQPWLPPGLYLAMGWLLIVVAAQLLERIPPFQV